MTEQEKWSDRLNKLISIADKASEGLNFIKGIVDECGEEEPEEVPNVPTKAEVQEIYSSLDEAQTESKIATKSYYMMADSMYEYCEYLKNWLNDTAECDADEPLRDNLKYIVAILSDVEYMLGTVSKLKHKNAVELLGRFDFVNSLIGENSSLAENYSLDFLNEVSKLWEIVVGIIDMIDEECGNELFSDKIRSIYEKNMAVNDVVKGIMELETRKKIRRKVIKKYLKYVRKSARKLEYTLWEKRYAFKRACKKGM